MKETTKTFTTMTCLRSDQNMEAQREREIMGRHACINDKKEKPWFPYY